MSQWLTVQMILSSRRVICLNQYLRKLSEEQVQTGEFDPGSERTFAAGLTHASRTRSLRVESGARVRNTWITNPSAWDNSGKPLLIPDTSGTLSGEPGKGQQRSLKDGSAAHQLVGEVKAHQGEDG